MSTRIEDAAMPILTPLIAGRSGTLTVEMQRILALWATKTVMVGEHVNPGQKFISQDERRYLKDSLQPPTGWFIWASPYSGREWRELGIVERAGELTVPSIDNGSPAIYHLGLTFIGMAHLCFVVKRTSWHRLQPIVGASILGLARIWPIVGPINWPTPHVATDREATELHAEFDRILDQPI
jgi:hypothetical protein